MNNRRSAEDYGNELQRLIDVLPSGIREWVLMQPLNGIMEIVLDLGRPVEVRFSTHSVWAEDLLVTQEQIDLVSANVGEFDRDNRTGISRTLHRISCILSRSRNTVGLTLRVGRPVKGAANVVEDLLQSGKSILFLGRPGVGKTTVLRDAAALLSMNHGKRVVIVDTNNEIGGYGDIPHPIIGRSRRMQVPRGTEQHEVMIEAVENHTPQVIVVDEIGTKAEAFAARTISERGVQLIATAHGNTLESLVRNPDLNDLLGGIQSVTLGDDEANRRGSQKTVLERKAGTTFDVVIEIRERHIFAVHTNVERVVDTLLRNITPHPQVRVQQPDGTAQVVQEEKTPEPEPVRPEPREQDRPSLTEPKPHQGKVWSVFFRDIDESLARAVVDRSKLNVRFEANPDNAHCVVALEISPSAAKRRLRRPGGRLPTFAVSSATFETVSGQLETAVRNLQRRPGKRGKMRR